MSETPRNDDSSMPPDQEDYTDNNIVSNSDDSDNREDTFSIGDNSKNIRDMLLEYEEEESLIRDRSLLDPNKVVSEDRIVGRDEQLEKITQMLRVAITGDRPPNMFLYGPSGTGKSLIINAVCNNLHELCTSRNIRFGVVEMNCQDIGTLDEAVFDLCRRVANDAGVELQVPENGVGTKQKWRELYRLVSKHYDTIVFILDELDMLTGRQSDDPAYSKLLYQLSRAGSSNDMDASVSIAALTNDTKMLDDVGSRALSSFRPEDIHFDDYNANQLRAILHRRKDAFADNVLSGDVIPLVGAFAAQTHGDARKAIDLFRVAGELAERRGDEKVQEKHVREAQDKVEKNRVLEVTRGISTQKKLCLYATAAIARESPDGAARSPDGYKVYKFITDAIDADQYHQETYVNKMKELTTYSLVEAKRKSDGPTTGVYIEFGFGESAGTIIETLNEDSRLQGISDPELTAVVNAQLR